MLLFWISIVLFIITLIGFMTMLGLWTYADAKVRTDNPAVWTLIVLLVPNLLGLIIYLLVGRTKMGKSIGKFKKMLITFAVCFILSTGLMVGSFVHLMVTDSFELPQHGMLIGTKVSIGKTENYWNKQWTVSFKVSSEELSKTVNMKDEDLVAFHVTGSCDSGKLYLKISQGEVEKTLDISNYNNEAIDMSDFDAGKIKVIIYNEEAKNADISISWR